MACRAQKTVLADGGMRTDFDFCNAVAINTFAEASVVAHHQIPGRPNAGGWIGMNGLAQLGAEELEQKGTPGVKQPRSRSVKRQPNQLPYRAGHLVAEREVLKLESLRHSLKVSIHRQSRGILTGQSRLNVRAKFPIDDRPVEHMRVNLLTVRIESFADNSSRHTGYDAKWGYVMRNN